MTTLSSLPAVREPDTVATAHRDARAARTARVAAHAQESAAVELAARAGVKASDLAAPNPYKDAMSGLSTVAIASAAVASMPALFGFTFGGATPQGQARPHHDDDQPGSIGIATVSLAQRPLVASPEPSSQNYASSQKPRDQSNSDSHSQRRSRAPVESPTGSGAMMDSAAAAQEQIGLAFDPGEPLLSQFNDIEATTADVRKIRSSSWSADMASAANDSGTAHFVTDASQPLLLSAMA